MNSYNSLDPSLFHRHDAHTIPQHDLSQEYRPQEITQNYSTFPQPPGAESLPRQHIEIGEQASRILNAQTDESNEPFYPSSPSRSASLSPSHSYPLQAPVSGKSQPLRHFAATQAEPKNSGIYPFPNHHPILRIIQAGTLPTLTSDRIRNHPRRPQRFLETDVVPQRPLPLPTPVHLKLPLRSQSY